MANLIKKFKRKRRLSSELHDRWGDTSISYPNDGSWNQWNQQAGFIANAALQSPNTTTDGTQRYQPVMPGPLGSPMSNASTSPGSPDPTQTISPFPKGYYNENIRRSDNSSTNPYPHGLGISAHSRHTSKGSKEHTDTEDSCDEDEERDTLGDDPGEGRIHRNYMTSDLRSSGRDDSGAYSDRASKSPALSVTSRMRRSSTQSSATQCSSVAGVNSRRTSYNTAASSVSAPSLPPDTPRFMYNGIHSAHADKRTARPKHREPDSVAVQQLVPSYDELYG